MVISPGASRFTTRLRDALPPHAAAERHLLSPANEHPDDGVLSGREDRLFPIDLQRRIACERLGLNVRDLPGGHLLALSQPSPLAEHLTSHA